MKSVFWVRPDAAETKRQTAETLWWVWWPAAVACVLILGESTATMSGSHTSSWLRPWFERGLGPVSDQFWAEFHHVLRKSGHFFGYGTVCLTFLRGWLWTLAGRLRWTLLCWRLRACAAAVASTAVLASLDEWHQTFLPGRTGQASDAVLDTCGGLLMCGLVSAVCLRVDSRSVDGS